MARALLRGALSVAALTLASAAAADELAGTCEEQRPTDSCAFVQTRFGFAKLAQPFEEPDSGEPLRRSEGEVLGGAATPPSASCPGASEAGCAPLDGKSAIAILIVGTRQRLLFNSTLERLVQPLASQGFAVHLYLSLVDRAHGISWNKMHRFGGEDPSISNLSRGELQTLLLQKVRAAGACPMCVSISSAKEKLPTIPRSSLYDARMTLYPPWKSAVGRNVLRVWQAREGLWNAALQAEKNLAMRYSLAFWTRDDQVWFSNITSPAGLLSVPGAERKVWSKGCLTWGGINDKSVILGRAAAEIMLTAYSSFFAKSPALHSVNAEKYLQLLAQVSGLSLASLPFAQIPCADAELMNGQLCVLKSYKCLEAPNDVYKQCEDVARASKSK